MITLTLLTMFGIAAFMIAGAVGLLSVAFNLFGYALRGLGWLMSVVFLPFALILAAAAGFGRLLPYLIGFGLVLLILAAIRPNPAQA